MSLPIWQRMLQLIFILWWMVVLVFSDSSKNLIDSTIFRLDTEKTMDGAYDMESSISISSFNHSGVDQEKHKLIRARDGYEMDIVSEKNS